MEWFQNCTEVATSLKTMGCWVRRLAEDQRVGVGVGVRVPGFTEEKTSSRKNLAHQSCFGSGSPFLCPNDRAHDGLSKLGCAPYLLQQAAC